MKRRRALLFLSVASLAAAAAPQRPNIVMFLVDDMGWQDPSVPFHRKVTPSQAPRVYFLAYPDRRPLQFTQANGSLTIHLPSKSPDPITSVVCVEH